MKKILVIILSVFAFVSCQKEEKGIWLVDWAPIEMFIYVQDANGQDLLNPQSESAINLDGITIEYEGETFTVKKKGIHCPRGWSQRRALMLPFLMA